MPEEEAESIAEIITRIGKGIDKAPKYKESWMTVPRHLAHLFKEAIDDINSKEQADLDTESR